MKKQSQTTSPQPMLSQKRDELNYFNALACLFVILIHVLSKGITSIERTSAAMVLVYMPWKFAAYVVPGFLFTGAVKMALGFNSGKDEKYIKYTWRRVTKIYVPYVITVCAYFAYFYLIGWYVADPVLLIKSILRGDISSPFYYIVTVMQFYLLMPLWRFTVKRIPWFTALPVSALITFASIRLSDVLNIYGISFLGSDRIFTSYLVFWMLGLYVGANYSKVYSVIMKHKVSILLCFIPVVLFAALNNWQYSSGNFVYTADANCMKVVVDILSIMAFMCLCIIIKNAKLRKTKKVLNFIFAASFSVYLSHCFFLNLADRYIIEKFGITGIALQLMVRFAVCYTLPFIWYVVLKKIKYPVKMLFKKKKA